MTERNKNEFFGDEKIKNLVEELWSKVFDASNKVIRDTKVFGFSDIAVIPNPNIHQMLTALTVIGNMLDMILFLDQNGKIEIKDTRLIFNAKQQILIMEMMASALRTQDRASYDQAVERLQKQAQF